MKKRSTGNPASTEEIAQDILSMLLTRGFDKTLEYFCTLSVFSVLSVA